MSKHTPGPWIAFENRPSTSGWTVYESEDGGDEIVTVARCLGEHADPTNEHNAKLIAAAPELAEALLAYMSISKTAKGARERRERAEAALKKAGLR